MCRLCRCRVVSYQLRHHLGRGRNHGRMRDPIRVYLRLNKAGEGQNERTEHTMLMHCAGPICQRPEDVPAAVFPLPRNTW